MAYEDGDIVNGHRLDAETNAWIPVDPVPKPPPGGRSPGKSFGPCSQCGSAVGVVRVTRVIDRLGGVVALVVIVALALLTQNLIGKYLGVLGAALIGALIGAAVMLPIVATRRYRCDDCGTEQPRPGMGASIERLSSGGFIAVMGAILAAILALILIANTLAHSYPEQVKAEFMAGCLSNPGATGNRCGCALDATQRLYTVEEFNDIEMSMRRGGQLPEQLKAVFANC